MSAATRWFGAAEGFQTAPDSSVVEYTIVLYGNEIHLDPAKARKNLRVHGVSFETAKEVFHDPNHVTQENYFIEDQGEQRLGIIGLTDGLVLLLVVFVDRSTADLETIHIISARKADKYEQSAYQDQFR